MLGPLADSVEEQMSSMCVMCTFLYYCDPVIFMEVHLTLPRVRSVSAETCTGLHTDYKGSEQLITRDVLYVLLSLWPSG